MGKSIAETYRSQIIELESKIQALKKDCNQKLIIGDSKEPAIRVDLRPDGGLSVAVNDCLTYDEAKRLAQWLNNTYLCSAD